MPQSVGAAAAPVANRYRGVDSTVGDADLNAFQGIHAAIQEAWSRADLGRMRQLMTPEMLGYFSEELSRSTSQGADDGGRLRRAIADRTGGVAVDTATPRTTGVAAATPSLSPDHSCGGRSPSGARVTKSAA